MAPMSLIETAKLEQVRHSSGETRNERGSERSDLGRLDPLISAQERSPSALAVRPRAVFTSIVFLWCERVHTRL